jgi:type II secretion system protein C
MKIKIPEWAGTTFWVILLVLTAFMCGQSASLYVKERLKVPVNMAVAREKVEKNDTRKPFTHYERELLPVFGESKKADGEKTSRPGKTPGAAAKKEPGEVDWDQVLTDPNPKLELLGTVIGSDTAIAFVNVAGKDVTLSIGQSVGSYYVSSINKNTMGFSNGGREKQLVMNLEQVPLAVLNAAYNPAPSPSPSESPEETASLDEIVSQQGDQRIIDRRKFNALLKPPSKLANDLKFIPNSKEGTPYGIKISYLKPDSFFSRIGLQSGDILVKTNMKELKSVEDSFYAYQAFRNEDHITLEVDRDGEIIQIPMEFR